MRFTKRTGIGVVAVEPGGIAHAGQAGVGIGKAAPLPRTRDFVFAKYSAHGAIPLGGALAGAHFSKR